METECWQLKVVIIVINAVIAVQSLYLFQLLFVEHFAVI